MNRLMAEQVAGHLIALAARLTAAATRGPINPRTRVLDAAVVEQLEALVGEVETALAAAVEHQRSARRAEREASRRAE